jgi:hypothetical protein
MNEIAECLDRNLNAVAESMAETEAVEFAMAHINPRLVDQLKAIPTGRYGIFKIAVSKLVSGQIKDQLLGCESMYDEREKRKNSPWRVRFHFDDKTGAVKAFRYAMGSCTAATNRIVYTYTKTSCSST